MVEAVGLPYISGELGREVVFRFAPAILPLLNSYKGQSDSFNFERQKNSSTQTDENNDDNGHPALLILLPILCNTYLYHTTQ